MIERIRQWSHDTTIGGIGLCEWPLALWLRFTYCTRHGHDYWASDPAVGYEPDDYCLNCGKERWAKDKKVLAALDPEEDQDE